MPTPRSLSLNLRNLSVVILGLCLLVVGVDKFLSLGKLPSSPFQAVLQDNIHNKLDQAEIGTAVKLTDLTPFTWQRVCGFGGYSGVTTINQTLGYPWIHQVPAWIPIVGGDQHWVWVDENSTLLVFLNNQKVVAFVNLPDRLVTVGDQPCFQVYEAQLETGETEVGNGHKTFYLYRTLRPGEPPRSM